VRQLWAYAYRVVPPPAGGLGDLRTLLDRENATAYEHARAWAAQLILEQRSTQILVVSDSPAQNRPVNRRLESELERLDAPFRVTDPIAIRGSPRVEAAAPLPHPPPRRSSSFSP
jgi:hypothetical protein